jgi:anti-sigma B factor antagonist
LTDPLLLERLGTDASPVIVARGEIDVATSPLLRSELASVLARGPQSVTLDLDGVTFVDSSGLGVLVGALKRLREAGGEHFTVLNAQESVRKVFDITGLSPLFELSDA